MNRKYYIIFIAKKSMTWWNWMLDKELYHCFIATACGKRSCVTFEFACIGSRVKRYATSVEDFVLSYIEKGNTNICEAYEGEIKGFRMPGLKTCVSITKDFLGINNPFIITSKQLFRHLRRTTK